MSFKPAKSRFNLLVFKGVFTFRDDRRIVYAFRGNKVSFENVNALFELKENELNRKTLTLVACTQLLY
jgi:hypothetical protein